MYKKNVLIDQRRRLVIQTSQENINQRINVLTSKSKHLEIGIKLLDIKDCQNNLKLQALETDLIIAENARKPNTFTR